jgi:hypothetical protein
MSVLSNIRAGIVALLEGSAGVDRTIAVGKYSVVGEDFEIQQARSVADPRPVYFEEDQEWEDDSLPTDVAGDFYYRSLEIPVYIGYGYSPDDSDIDRAQDIDDDEALAIRCFTYPLNWALTTGWCGCEVVATRVPIRDAAGVIAIMFNRLALRISFREDYS